MSYEPIPAEGSGSEVFDQPALFYLSNRSLIDEWYGLRVNVFESLGEWYRTTVRESLAVEAADRELEVSVANGPGGYRHLLMHPTEIPIIGNKPILGVGFAWPSKSIDPSASSMFACVRRSKNKTGEAAAARFLEAGGRDYRVSTPDAKGTDTDTWPVWSWIRADDRWWTDLDRYRDLIVAEVVRLIDDEGIRRALAAAATVPVLGGPDESE